MEQTMQNKTFTMYNEFGYPYTLDRVSKAAAINLLDDGETVYICGVNCDPTDPEQELIPCDSREELAFESYCWQQYKSNNEGRYLSYYALNY